MSKQPRLRLASEGGRQLPARYTKSAPRDPARASYRQALENYQAARKAIEDSEARFRAMDHEGIGAGIAVEEAEKALDAARTEAAKRMAQGREDPRIMRKTRERLQEAQDRYETVQAAKAQLREGFAELRTRHAVAELRYEEALKGLVQNSPGVLALLEAHEAAIRTAARYSRALDVLSARGLLPVVFYGELPAADPDLDALAEQWKAAISELESP
jgi:hypothetical protein